MRREMVFVVSVFIEPIPASTAPLYSGFSGGEPQMGHLPLVKDLVVALRDETGTIVRFQNQWRSVAVEQALQRSTHRLSGAILDRKPEQLDTAGQVADRQQVGVTPINRQRWLGKVNGPDRARVLANAGRAAGVDGGAARCGDSGGQSPESRDGPSPERMFARSARPCEVRAAR